MGSESRAMAAWYEVLMVNARAVAAVCMPLLVILSSTVDAYADTADASTVEAKSDGGDCAAMSSEDACIALSGCAWGVPDAGPDAGPECFGTGGPVYPQPGTGDPGGGGQAAGDEGCSFSGRPTSGLPCFFVVVLFGLTALNRRARFDPGRARRLAKSRR